MPCMRLMIQTLAIAMSIVLTACAGEQTPVALETVHPEQDPSGFYDHLIAGSDEVPLKLIDAVERQGLSRKIAATGFMKYDRYRSYVNNPAYITIIDFTQHSSKRRFYMINRITGKVDTLTAAHGAASDPDKDGNAQYFSNIPDSRMSSLGSYIINERYVGKHGPSLRMDGLEKTNSNARARSIVLHPSSYVEDGRSKQGMSWGCPAVPFAWIDKVISRLRDGSFMFAHGNNKYVKTTHDIFWENLSLQPGFVWSDES